MLHQYFRFFDFFVLCNRRGRAIQSVLSAVHTAPPSPFAIVKLPHLPSTGLMSPAPCRSTRALGLRLRTFRLLLLLWTLGLRFGTLGLLLLRTLGLLLLLRTLGLRFRAAGVRTEWLVFIIVKVILVEEVFQSSCDCRRGNTVPTAWPINTAPTFHHCLVILIEVKGLFATRQHSASFSAEYRYRYDIWHRCFYRSIRFTFDSYIMTLGL